MLNLSQQTNKIMKNLQLVVAQIEKQTGIQLTLDTYFDGLRIDSQGRHYFNVEDSQTAENSVVLRKLLHARKYGLVKSIEPNGYHRFAIFI